MNDYINSLGFSKLLSHVFPGFLLTFSFFMLIDLLCENPGSYTCNMFIDQELENFIVIVGLFLIIGAVLGVIIDGIQHISITVYYTNKIKRTEPELCGKYKKIYKLIDSILLETFSKECSADNKVKIAFANELCDDKNNNNNNNNNILNYLFYFSLINTDKYSYYDENFFHYYEFFSNITLVLLPTSVLFFFYSQTVLKFPCLLSIIITLIIFITTIICYHIAWVVFKKCYTVRLNLILGALVDKVIR